MGGRDVTFFRDAPTQVESWSSGDPFGDATLLLNFPQVTPYEAFGFGALDWLNTGKQVDLRLVRPDGTVGDLWNGLVASWAERSDENSYSLSAECVGVLYQADFSVKPPRFEIGSRDIGQEIADTLNTVQSRDYAALAPVTTGIITYRRGAWTSRLTGHVQDLLSQATTRDGLSNWTLMHVGRVPVLHVKDRTTVHATLHTGSPGVRLALSQDISQTPNVIYGSGVDPEGCWWGNSKYPNFRFDDAPLYPLSSTSTFSAGSGTGGFGPFATEMRANGYPMASGDTYLTADVNHVRDAQARAGIQVDGVVGPQTWAGVFQVGSNVGDLSGAYFAPLDWDARVEERAYSPSGADIGPNPIFVPDALRVERYVNYGEGVYFHQGVASAYRERVRSEFPGFFGRIDLEIDPPERSRFELRAGMNVQVRAHRGVDRLLHVGKVTVNWQSESVTLDVDEHARDLMTLASLVQRDRASAEDPARRNSPLTNRRSRNVRDSVTPFDCSAGAGRIPKHALFGGLWTVVRIPAGQLGSIARTEFTVNSSVTEFAVGVFGKPVTPADLKRLVGNPLAAGAGAGATGIARPWSPETDALQAAGLLIAWGSFDQPMGYYPGAKSELDPLTGRFRDDATWYFDTVLPPWLWVAEYSPVGTFIEGRLYPGIEQTT